MGLALINHVWIIESLDYWSSDYCGSTVLFNY